MDKMFIETARLVAQACLQSSITLNQLPLLQQPLNRLSTSLYEVLEPYGLRPILEQWGRSTKLRIIITFGEEVGYMPVSNETGEVSGFVVSHGRIRVA